jgi:hypothetical protein
MTFIHKVCGSLDNSGVRYALVGGHAVALHGAIRGTFDVDIAVDWTQNSLKKTEQALRSIGLESRLPVTAAEIYQFRDEYVRNRNLVAWNFFSPKNPIEQVDIIITYDLKGKKRQRLDTAAGPVHVLNRKDLIDMKRLSGRPQDLEDVSALERLK